MNNKNNMKLKFKNQNNNVDNISAIKLKMKYIQVINGF